MHSHTFLSARVFPYVSFAVLGDFLLPPVVVATFTADFTPIINITFKVNLTITSMHAHLNLNLYTMQWDQISTIFMLYIISCMRVQFIVLHTASNSVLVSKRQL